jgi:hypothetical protein
VRGPFTQSPQPGPRIPASRSLFILIWPLPVKGRDDGVFPQRLDPAGFRASVAKDDVAEPGPGQAMDLALRFEYHEGPGLLVVLVEHWSSADKLDLLRTARYYLDLCRRFPLDEVLPIALVDDDKPHDLENSVCAEPTDTPTSSSRHAWCRSPPWRWKPIEDIQPSRPVLSSEHARKPRCRVRPGRDHRLPPSGRPGWLRLLFAFWVVEGRLNSVEQRELNQRLKEHEMPEIMDWLRGGRNRNRSHGGCRGGDRERHPCHQDRGRPQDARTRHCLGNRHRRDRNQARRPGVAASESEVPTPPTRRYQPTRRHGASPCRRARRPRCTANLLA